MRQEEAALDGAGRVLLRKSGTEPLVRVMVEAQTQEQADAVATRLAGVVARSASPSDLASRLHARVVDDVAGDLEGGRRGR